MARNNDVPYGNLMSARALIRFVRLYRYVPPAYPGKATSCKPVFSESMFFPKRVLAKSKHSESPDSVDIYII